MPGNAKLMGLVESTLDLPPQGATKAPYALTIIIPIMSFSAASSGYSARRPTWFPLNTATVPVPYFFAFSMASSIAIFPLTCP